jgi:uncharacterized protein (UPF0335 family)
MNDKLTKLSQSIENLENEKKHLNRIIKHIMLIKDNQSQYDVFVSTCEYINTSYIKYTDIDKNKINNIKDEKSLLKALRYCLKFISKIIKDKTLEYYKTIQNDSIAQDNERNKKAKILYQN